jgi:hypothetical protein
MIESLGDLAGALVPVFVALSLGAATGGMLSEAVAVESADVPGVAARFSHAASANTITKAMTIRISDSATE